MNGVSADYTGKRIGMLTVEGIAGRQGSRRMWRCRCDCGNETVVRTDHLNDGRVLSCGCLGKERRAETHRKHGGAHTRLYGVWCNMKNRCYNKNVRSFKNYGAKGVKVCDEWLNSFAEFSKWAIETGYNQDAEYGECTLERVDVYGDYCPENCTWVDAKAQANNRRRKDV